MIIDLDTATAEELQELKNVGPHSAAAIIDNRPLSSWEELHRCAPKLTKRDVVAWHQRGVVTSSIPEFQKVGAQGVGDLMFFDGNFDRLVLSGLSPTSRHNQRDQAKQYLPATHPVTQHLTGVETRHLPHPCLVQARSPAIPRQARARRTLPGLAHTRLPGCLEK